MSKQPAVIIIARHGARLDAADQAWHLSSPTPYDPPLTYGGWTQSRALGLRIAALLDAREQNATSNSDSTSPTKSGQTSKKRKHKVFIHSSPFQRCVQTSIGISAGLSQYNGVPAGRARSESTPRSPGHMFPPSPRLHAVGELRPREQFRKTAPDQNIQSKTDLRVDAFLGEWLSPDYFDHITPPPNSVLMVAGAKADLLRKGEDIDVFSLSSGNTGTRAPSGNLWGSSSKDGPQTSKDMDGGPLDMKSLGQSLPRRDRTSSYSSGGGSSSRRLSPYGRQPTNASSPLGPETARAYVPPTPSYAVSPVEQIPKGYVAHARDACVTVDYQWDSMREPLSWGDGGDFGEEWSAMHKRFRKGFHHMVNWYDQNGAGRFPDEHEAVPDAVQHDNEADEDEEIAIVLVTHAAACNALIGALTDQPVLLDVGMASLTMAVRKDRPNSANGEKRNSTTNLPSDIEHPLKSHNNSELAQAYEMKLLASTDHLRPGTDPARPTIPLPNSPKLSAAATIPDSRRRSTLLSHAAAGSPIETVWTSAEPGRGSMSAALGSMRRPSAATIVQARSGSVSSLSSMNGLWAPSTPPLAESKSSTPPNETSELTQSPTSNGPAGDDNKLGITFTNTAPTPVRSEKRPDGEMLHGVAEGSDGVPDLPNAGSQAPTGLNRTLSQKGLWGSAPRGAQQDRERGPKRRWTVQQE